MNAALHTPPSLPNSVERCHAMIGAMERDMRRLEEFESGLAGDISAEDAFRQVRESLS